MAIHVQLWESVAHLLHLGTSFADVIVTIPLPSSFLTALAAFEALAGSVMTVVGTSIGAVHLTQQLSQTLRGRKELRQTGV